MNQNDNYLREISKLWVIKEKIYEETKKMDFKQYLEYLKKNIQPLKKRLKAKPGKAKGVWSPDSGNHHRP